MNIILSKQVEKYLDKCDDRTYRRLKAAIDGLENVDGDIACLQERKDEYRLIKPPYRIIFEYKLGSNDIFVKHIGSRGDAYKKG